MSDKNGSAPDEFQIVSQNLKAVMAIREKLLIDLQQIRSENRELQDEERKMVAELNKKLGQLQGIIKSMEKNAGD